MHTPRSNATVGPRSPGRRLAWPFAWIAALLGLAGLVLPPGASAGPPSPPTVTLTLSTENTTYLGGAVPRVLAQAGVTSILVDLKSTSSFNQDVTFTLNVTLADPSSKPSGALTPNTLTLRAGQTDAQTSVTYSAVDNGVVITAVPVKKQPTVTSVPSDPFDSLRTLEYADKGATSLGGNTCTQTTQESNCGVAVMPLSFSSDQAALSTGACSSGLNCKTGSTIVQFIANMGSFATGDSLYTQTSPATLIIRCDKTQCGNGGVTKFNIYYTLSATGPLNIQAPACLVKGQANPAPTDANGGPTGPPVPCTDYVNSTRDNAGDLLLWLNFTEDIRSTGY